MKYIIHFSEDCACRVQAPDKIVETIKKNLSHLEFKEVGPFHFWASQFAVYKLIAVAISKANEEECKFHKDGKCYIDDMIDKIDCTGKGHDLEHCGDYQAYKAEEENESPSIIGYFRWKRTKRFDDLY